MCNCNKVKSRGRSLYEGDPSKIEAAVAALYKLHPEKKNASDKAYYSAYKEERNASDHKEEKLITMLTSRIRIQPIIVPTKKRRMQLTGPSVTRLLSS